MPELPEVETMRRGVLPVVGSRIVQVTRPPCRLKPIAIQPGLAAFRRRVVGHRIDAFSRRGKRVVAELETGTRMVFEPRMTGLVLLADPPNQEHLRLAIELDGQHQQLLYWDRRGLGSVRLFTAAAFEETFGDPPLGPDALDVTGSLLAQRLGQSRRAVKVALLDQAVVAGIGNLYASELLHVAGVHPELACDRIRKTQWQAIAEATLEILNAAIRYEGSTLGDGTYRTALNQQGGYQNHHRVYDKADEVCAQCGKATIRRIVQAQRSTFFCPRCQAKRRRATTRHD